MLRLRVRHKVIGTFLALWLMCVALGMVWEVALLGRSDAYRDVIQTAEGQDTVVAVNTGIQRIYWLLQDLRAGNTSLKAEIKEVLNRTAERSASLKDLPWNAEEAKVVELVQQEFGALQKQTQAILAGARVSNEQNYAKRRRVLTREMERLLGTHSVSQAERWKSLQHAQTMSSVLFTFALTVMFAAAIGLSLILSRWIDNKITKLSKATEPVSKGDLSRRVEIKSKDEFGELAERFNRMMDELEKMFIGAVEALATSVDAKSPWTAGHSKRVTQYALDTGQQMNLDDRTMTILRISGLLHDIGKICVPDVILDKADRLTDEEYDKIKEHPIEGYRIIEKVPHMKEMLPGIRNHHERYDGKGYPDGLKGDAIPLLARVLAVADAYDAMTSKRPYRDGMPEEKALRIFADDRGQQWDEDIVDAFMRTRDPNLSRVRQASDTLQLPVSLRAAELKPTPAPTPQAAASEAA